MSKFPAEDIIALKSFLCNFLLHLLEFMNHERETSHPKKEMKIHRSSFILSKQKICYVWLKYRLFFSLSSL